MGCSQSGARPAATPSTPPRTIDSRPTPPNGTQRPTPATIRPSGAGAATGGKPPINPFLANDPNQKARRLARALVSDMVAYHPAKRDEGLQGGTLKQLFRDEIVPGIKDPFKR